MAVEALLVPRLELTPLCLFVDTPENSLEKGHSIVYTWKVLPLTMDVEFAAILCSFWKWKS